MDEQSLKLLNLLLDKLGDSALKIYYMPTREMDLEKPCIVYTLKRDTSVYANNVPYMVETVYSVVLMTNIAEVSLRNTVLSIPGMSHIQTYVTSDIVNDIFEITIN